MKKILMIGMTFPEEGGSERHIYELAKRMKNVVVLTQKGSSCPRKIELPILKGKLRSYSFFLSCVLYSFYLLFSKKEYDTIHIHENLLYFLIPILRLRYNVITTIHGIKGFKFYDNKLFWRFFSKPLLFANLIIAVNIEDKKILSNYFKKIEYIPNGVDISMYDGINPKIENKISFMGRMHEQKGLIYLLEAYKLLKEKSIHFKLEIMGEINDYSKELQRKFPEKNIIWKGFMKDRKEIARSFKSAYCIVMPSLWEGLPLILFEALASERPLILSDIKAFKSVVNNEAIFFKNKNPIDLFEKLKSILSNPKKAKQIGKFGGILSKKYSWDNISKKTMEAYGK